MERRWDKVWPLWVPKTINVEKPTSEYIREWAALTPEKIAISFYGRDITYAVLNETIDRLAWGLVDLGVTPGDRVGLQMENCPQFVMAYFAIQRSGAVVVPVNPMFKQAELEYEINDGGIETLIGQDTLYPEVEKIRRKTALKNVLLTSLKEYLPPAPLLPLPSDFSEDKRLFPDTMDLMSLADQSKSEPICRVTDLENDLALLQYTGGTTGLPKGAMISHYTLSCANLGAMHWFHHREDDIHLGVTPFFHVMGQQQLMCTPLVSGGRIVILSRFVPAIVAQAISHYRCTYWVGATTMMIALLAVPDIEKYDLSSFRVLLTGGTPISTELQKRIKELAPRAALGEGYGLSETISHGGAVTPLYRYKPGFIGTPQLNHLKIMDLETGTREKGPNEEGEIAIKGPAVMKGYWNKAAETKEVLRDGWLYTGDIGLMDEEGYVKLLGRKRELIKCSGYSVFPPEVEDLLFRHPAVKEAAVIGVQDPYRGESPKAFIILNPDYAGKISPEEILAWCKDNMAAYKRPRSVEFRQELPKSAAGKILKRILIEEEKKTQN
ncbi:MAG TPA: AMP-binding protein [Thermodesulfobacteriota bacterium]|nr:AMP-binding protein [Thermodesulfobacteriota bacterium]